MVAPPFAMPKQQIQEGIIKCINKSKSFLDDAEVLILNKGTLANAFCLYTFAIEEYGKALLLQSCLSGMKTKKGKFPVRRLIFKDHLAKIFEALINLPEVCKKFSFGIVVPMNLSNIGFTKRYRVRNSVRSVTVTPLTTGHFSNTSEPKDILDFILRLDCLYVNWNENDKQWTEEISPIPSDLQKAIQELRKVVQALHSTL